MPQRLVVFVDYQNTYRSARTAFHDHERDPHWYGQVHPSALGALLARVSSDDLELHQVRMYRGMPSNDKDPRGYNAAQRQVLAWKKSPRAPVTTRPLRPALETVSTLHGVKGEVAAWGTSSGYGRRLSVPGHNIWCHWITEAAYTTIRDDTDYNKKTRRRRR